MGFFILMMKTKFQKRPGFKHRGVALLIVLASLALLSGLVVEFSYNSNVTYNLAMNERDRLQAYYLAQSGINFSKLIIKFDKEAKKVAQKASKKLGQTVQIPPLYEMIPLNTALIRGLSQLGQEGGESGEGLPQGEEAGEEGGEVSQVEESIRGINLGGAEDFLDFEGDFSSEVHEEDIKLNLNAFYTLTPTQKSYDRLKGTLYHLLTNPEFEGMFEDRYRGAKELAQSIVDYIDRDDSYNEPGGQERGREGVTGGKRVTMKNGKLISIEELIMVPGMTEEIYQKLKTYVTIYGKDEKINLCRAEEPLVRAMVLGYTDNNPKMEPIKDDNEELLTKATEAVLNNCPDAAAMSRELDKALGVTTEGGTQASSTSTASAKGKTTTGKTKQKSSSSVKFGDLIKDKVEIFSIVSTGTLGESEVKLKTVLDTTKSNPRQWQELYWRIE